MLNKETISDIPMDHDKKLKAAKKEITTVIKENQKLQSELKIKNETINSLINQNFSELKSLQEKHEEIINSLTTIYDTNVKNMEDKYKSFRKSFNMKLKDNINTFYKFNNEKTALLEEHNKNLLNKLNEIQIISDQKELENRELIEKKDSKIKELNENMEQKIKILNEEKELKTKELYEQYSNIHKKFKELELEYESLKKFKEKMENHYEELKGLHNNQKNIIIENDKKISDLKLDKESLETELRSANLELSKNNDTIKRLTIEVEHTKNTYQDIYNKYVLLLNDNVIKQNSIDEKTLEILSLNSKIGEIEKKNILLETTRKDNNIKITELIHQIDNLQSELLSAQKIAQQSKIEKDILLDGKTHYIKEADQYKQKMNEIESIMLERIKQLQETANKEKNEYIFGQENKLKEQKEKFDKQIMAIQNEYSGIISEREKQIDGLTIHLKSIIDNQYLTLNEVEKLKSINEKIKKEQTNIDQQINNIHLQYKKEIDDLRMSHKKEKDTLIESCNDTIKKSQELNEALQNRLNQTVEALGLSKIAISNLKETNQNMEKQIQSRETEENSCQEKYDQIKSENIALREKLERSIELNNSFSNKEKQYETQIKQLQVKCAQLINLTKKNMNNVSQ